MSESATLVQCPSCGQRFTCDPAGACWCMALPPVTPRPEEASGCFCPNCLAQRARMEHDT